MEFGHGLRIQPVHFMPSAHAAHTAPSLRSAMVLPNAVAALVEASARRRQ